MHLLLLLLYLVNISFTAKEECHSQSDVGVQSEDVEITFLKKNCSMSCHIDKVKVKTTYVIKLLKQINGSFYDVLHIRRLTESHKPQWFPCTDLRNRSSHVGSNLDRMMFNISTDMIVDSDNAVYKCAIDCDCESHIGTYWNTAFIEWTDCSKNKSKQSTKPSLSFILLTFLYIMIE